MPDFEYNTAYFIQNRDYDFERRNQQEFSNSELVEERKLQLSFDEPS